MTEQKELLGLSCGCLLTLAILLLVTVSGAGFTVWYNMYLSVPVQNSMRHAQTCDESYVAAQKARINNDLTAISDAQLEEVHSRDDQTLVAQLKAQENTNARDILSTLDASSCAKSVVINDLQLRTNVFEQYPQIFQGE